MILVGFAFVWVGYLQGVYGYTLLRGYDIRWRDLANPLHPYQWPPRGQQIPTVPKSAILPAAPASAAPASAAGPPSGGGGPVAAA